MMNTGDIGRTSGADPLGAQQGASPAVDTPSLLVEGGTLAATKRMHNMQQRLKRHGEIPFTAGDMTFRARWDGGARRILIDQQVDDNNGWVTNLRLDFRHPQMGAERVEGADDDSDDDVLDVRVYRHPHLPDADALQLREWAEDAIGHYEPSAPGAAGAGGTAGAARPAADIAPEDDVPSSRSADRSASNNSTNSTTNTTNTTNSGVKNFFHSLFGRKPTSMPTSMPTSRPASSSPSRPSSATGATTGLPGRHRPADTAGRHGAPTPPRAGVAGNRIEPPQNLDTSPMARAVDDMVRQPWVTEVFGNATPSSRPDAIAAGMEEHLDALDNRERLKGINLREFVPALVERMVTTGAIDGRLAPLGRAAADRLAQYAALRYPDVESNPRGALGGGSNLRPYAYPLLMAAIDPQALASMLNTPDRWSELVDTRTPRVAPAQTDHWFQGMRTALTQLAEEMQSTGFLAPALAQRLCDSVPEIIEHARREMHNQHAGPHTASGGQGAASATGGGGQGVTDAEYAESFVKQLQAQKNFGRLRELKRDIHAYFTPGGGPASAEPFTVKYGDRLANIVLENADVRRKMLVELTKLRLD